MASVAISSSQWLRRLLFHAFVALSRIAAMHRTVLRSSNMFHNAATAKTYATWNASDKGAGVTLSNGNLTFAGTNNNGARSTIGKSAGKWYWEITIQGVSNDWTVGIADSSASLTGYIGSDAHGWSYLTIVGFGTKKATNAVLTDYGAAYTGNDVIGVALDMDGGTVEFYKNGVSQGVAYNSGLTGTIYAALGEDTMNATANFGASAFSYSVPAGYNSGLYN